MRVRARGLSFQKRASLSEKSKPVGHGLEEGGLKSAFSQNFLTGPTRGRRISIAGVRVSSAGGTVAAAARGGAGLDVDYFGLFDAKESRQ